MIQKWTDHHRPVHFALFNCFQMKLERGVVSQNLRERITRLHQNLAAMEGAGPIDSVLKRGVQPFQPKGTEWRRSVGTAQHHIDQSFTPVGRYLLPSRVGTVLKGAA